MFYLSFRHFEYLTVGLITGGFEHFNVFGKVHKSETKYQGQEAIEIAIKLL